MQVYRDGLGSVLGLAPSLIKFVLLTIMQAYAQFSQPRTINLGQLCKRIYGFYSFHSRSLAFDNTGRPGRGSQGVRAQPFSTLHVSQQPGSTSGPVCPTVRVRLTSTTVRSTNRSVCCCRVAVLLFVTFSLQF